jgi:hypothetical protein
MIRSYLLDKEILIGENLTPRRVTCGVPQGSVLRPALWNIFYDGLLDTHLPDGTQTIAYADDVAVLATARNANGIEEIMNPALEVISDWISSHGLQLAVHKTEAVMLTNKNVFTNPNITVDGTNVEIKKSVVYLGVELDQRLSFTAHIARAAKSAINTSRAIARLMPNTGGPMAKNRKLLASVVQSKLLYAAPVWAESGTKTAKNRQVLLRAQRITALRIIRAYRTVSDQAALLLAGIPPGHLLANEHRDKTKGPDSRCRCKYGSNKEAGTADHNPPMTGHMDSEPESTMVKAIDSGGWQMDQERIDVVVPSIPSVDRA